MNKEKRIKKRKKIRKKIFGTKERPRLNVFKSNQHIYLQMIDDEKGETLVSVNSLQLKEKLSNKEKVFKVAEILTQKALAHGIKKVVFDRGGFSYKGRVKMIAEELRKKGLEF